MRVKIGNLRPEANFISQKLTVKFLLEEFLWIFLHFFGWTYVNSQVFRKQLLWSWAEFTPWEKKGGKFQLKVWEIPPGGILLCTFDSWKWCYVVRCYFYAILVSCSSMENFDRPPEPEFRHVVRKFFTLPVSESCRISAWSWSRKQLSAQFYAMRMFKL